jgi:hypothetical protein
MNILKIALLGTALVAASAAFAGVRPEGGSQAQIASYRAPEGNGFVNIASYRAPEGNGFVETASYAAPEQNSNVNFGG